MLVCRLQSTRRHVPDFSSLTENFWTDCSSDRSVWALPVSGQSAVLIRTSHGPVGFTALTVLRVDNRSSVIVSNIRPEDYSHLNRVLQAYRVSGYRNRPYSQVLWIRSSLRLSLFIRHLVSVGFHFLLPLHVTLVLT